MNVLAIDTATEILAVALETDSPPRRVAIVRDAGLRHAAALMPAVRLLLADLDIALAAVDLVVCAAGPGSFTGLRIGMATAKGLVEACAPKRALGVRPGAPAAGALVSVPTLDALAWSPCALAQTVVPVIDARKGRYYAAVFRDGVRATVDLDLEASAVARRALDLAASGPIVVCGPGAERFLETVIASPEIPAAETARFRADRLSRQGCVAGLLALGRAAFRERGPDPADSGPNYVRGSDAELARTT